MQASSPRKKLRFFVLLGYYMRLSEKNQGLFPIFIAKVIDNFCNEIVAFFYGVIFSKYSLCFNMRSLNNQCRLLMPDCLIPGLLINRRYTYTRITKSCITGFSIHFSRLFCEMVLILDISNRISLVLWKVT